MKTGTTSGAARDPQRDALGERAVQQALEVAHERGDVDDLRRDDLAAAEHQQLARQRRGAVRRAADLLDVVADRVVVGQLALGEADAGRGSPTSRLLKSCATPPASWPTDSSRCACASRASSSARSSALRRRSRTTSTTCCGDLDLRRLRPARAARRPPGLDDVEEIGRAADRAAALTRQLLMFSRREVVTPQVVDVAALVRDLERLLNRTLSERVALRISCGPDVVPVFIDPAQLEQVLVNLAVNARDAMPEGGTLSIAVAGSEGGVRITVADDGTGCATASANTPSSRS